MSIPEEVRNAAWNGNWQDDEETIHPDSRKADRGCSTRPTQWQRTGDEIDAAMIFAASEFVKGRWLHGMVGPLACYTQ